MAEPIVEFGVILAGGQGRRMGNVSKPLVKLQERSLLDWAVAAARPQVSQLMLNVNGNLGRYGHLGLPLIQDIPVPVTGPLVGIVSAMKSLAPATNKQAPSKLLACFPVDGPSYPERLVEILASTLLDSNLDAAVVECEGQIQPLFSVWRTSCLPVLEAAISNGFIGPKMVLPLIQHKVVNIDPGERNGIPYFTNINTIEDLETVQKSISQ